MGEDLVAATDSEGPTIWGDDLGRRSKATIEGDDLSATSEGLPNRTRRDGGFDVCAPLVRRSPSVRQRRARGRRCTTKSSVSSARDPIA